MISKKKKISMQGMVEKAIRLLFFFLYPALFSTAFSGVKMIIEQISKREILTWNSFVATLIVLLIFTIIFGRFFCGFICAFGTWGDFVYGLSSIIQKKRKKKPLHCFQKAENILRYAKYIVLFVILVLCANEMGSMISMHSPFSTFSRFCSLKMSDSYLGTILFLLITIGMALEPRFFCRFLCPMGAIFSLLPILPFSIVKRNKENCIPGCRVCKMTCPANLEIPSYQEGDNRLSGECFSCGKCMLKCPKQNICSAKQRKLWLLIFLAKSLLFLGICLFIYA